MNNNSKEIFNELYKANFKFFDVTVYGQLLNTQDYMSTSIKSDQIIFEMQKYKKNQIKWNIERDIYGTYLLKFDVLQYYNIINVS